MVIKVHKRSTEWHAKNETTSRIVEQQPRWANRKLFLLRSSLLLPPPKRWMEILNKVKEERERARGKSGNKMRFVCVRAYNEDDLEYRFTLFFFCVLRFCLILLFRSHFFVVFLRFFTQQIVCWCLRLVPRLCDFGARVKREERRYGNNYGLNGHNINSPFALSDEAKDRKNIWFRLSVK